MSSRSFPYIYYYWVIVLFLVEFGKNMHLVWVFQSDRAVFFPNCARKHSITYTIDSVFSLYLPEFATISRYWVLRDIWNPIHPRNVVLMHTMPMNCSFDFHVIYNIHCENSPVAYNYSRTSPFAINAVQITVISSAIIPVELKPNVAYCLLFTVTNSWIVLCLPGTLNVIHMSSIKALLSGIIACWKVESNSMCFSQLPNWEPQNIYLIFASTRQNVRKFKVKIWGRKVYFHREVAR